MYANNTSACIICIKIKHGVARLNNRYLQWKTPIKVKKKEDLLRYENLSRQYYTEKLRASSDEDA